MYPKPELRPKELLSRLEAVKRVYRNGHLVNDPLEDCLERAKDVPAFARRLAEKTATDKSDVFPSVEHATRFLMGECRTVKEAGGMALFLRSEGHYCFLCGRNTYSVLTKSGAMRLVTRSVEDRSYSFKYDTGPCPMANASSYSSEVDCDGKLRFANFFHGPDNLFHADEVPKDDVLHRLKYGRGLNCLAGRAEICRETASRCGILYGQTGNTSVTAYRNGDRIALVGPSERDDGPKGWTRVGRISCDMWRFEVLGRAPKKRPTGMFEVSVGAGRYRMTHYYDSLRYRGKRLPRVDGKEVWTIIEPVN